MLGNFCMLFYVSNYSFYLILKKLFSKKSFSQSVENSFDPDQAQHDLLGLIWVQIGKGEKLSLAGKVISKRISAKEVLLKLSF